jgi:futalosine hydrolase
MKPGSAPCRLLIVSAWSPELAYLRARLPHLPVSVGRAVTLGTVGVGLVEAGMGAARLIESRRPSMVLLVGTAGLYPDTGEDCSLEDVAIADHLKLLGEILPGKHSYLPGPLAKTIRCAPSLVSVLKKTMPLPCLDVACPLAITASTKAAFHAARTSDCALENLEAFSVACAAKTAKLPFAAILGISNHVGPSGHAQWLRHAKSSAQAACQVVIEYLAKTFRQAL